MTTGPEPRIRTEAGFARASPVIRDRVTARRAPRTGRTPRARRAGPGAPSGWYWTVSIGRSRWRSPSTEPSLRLTWLTRNPDAARQRVADDLDLVVLRGHLDQPHLEVLDRVVGAVMPEAEPASCRRPRPGHDLVAEADPEQRPAVVDDRAGQRHLLLEAGGSPGPGDRITPSMSDARTSDGGAVCGKHADARAAEAHRADDVGLEPEVDDRRSAGRCRRAPRRR